MFLPELRRTLKRFLPDSGESISLNLKSASTVNADAAWYMQNGYPQLASMVLGGMPTWSGETVGLEAALGHSVIWACVNLISRAIGFMDAILKIEQPDGDTSEAREHPMYEGMRHAPNVEISAKSFTELLTLHCLLFGNGFAKIIRRSGTGTAIELHPLLPQQVSVEREKDGLKRLRYVVKEPGSSDKTYVVERGKPHDILHLRAASLGGLRGMSVLEFGKNSIGTAVSGERNLARFFAMGGRTPYHIELTQKFRTTQDADQWRADWESLMAQPHRAPIADPGIKVVPDGLSMRDAQGVEFRLSEIAEMCRWFNVSPTLVGDASRSTFNNQEQYMLQFVKMTLQDWMTMWEQDFRRCVLTDEERAKGYLLDLDERTLLRGDFAAQMAGFATSLQNGYFNIDEVRRELGKNKLPAGAGSHYHIQVNMGTLIKDGQIQPAIQNPSLIPLTPDPGTTDTNA